jgi:transcriptional regulator with XRE-family HTH domain
MDNKSEVRDFLVSRRARVNPDQAGLRLYGGQRRVPGLRREEVALLAGVSVDYYTRLERGNLAGASKQVLDALARALRLDGAEREHLEHLARLAGPGRTGQVRRRTGATVRPVVQRILDSMGAPAFARNGQLDVVGANELGKALYSPMYTDPTRPVNHARFNFLSAAARQFWGDWDRAAYDTVAILRAEAGRDPYDKQLTALVGELSTRSDEFRRLWGSHDVKHHDTGVKTFDHPVVGHLDLAFESFQLVGDNRLTILAYSAEPGSPSDDGLKVLSSWAVTQQDEEPASRA